LDISYSQWSLTVKIDFARIRHAWDDVNRIEPIIRRLIWGQIADNYHLKPIVRPFICLMKVRQWEKGSFASHLGLHLHFAHKIGDFGSLVE